MNDNVASRRLERLFRVKDPVSGEYFWISGSGKGGPLITFPQPADISAYYPQDYYSFKTGIATIFEESRKPAKRLINFLRKKILEEFYDYFKTGEKSSLFWKPALFPLKSMMLKFPSRIYPESKLLDVGCGTGGYIWNLKELGWNACGVEINEKTALQLRRKGMEVFAGDFERLDFPESEYDVVTFWHTLEHLRSPLESLKKAHRILKPDGMVMIEVPNVASLERKIFGRNWALWDVPRHLYHFSPQSLVKLLSESGFRKTMVSYPLDLYDFPRSIQNVMPWQKPRILLNPKRMRWTTKYLLFPLAVFLSATKKSNKLLVIAEKGT